MAKNDILTLEAEEVGGELEQVIETALEKQNVTNKVISTLKEKYGGLRLKNVDDKEGYLEIKEARKEVRKWGILTENICKKGRQDAIAIQKKWLWKEKEILGKIAEVEDPLQAEIDRYDAEIERKATEEANRKENEYMQRQSLLIKMGATYQDGSFNLNHISYEATTVREADADIWEETILPKYKREFEKNESVRVAEEKKREQETEALRLQQQEMDRQRKEFELQQAEFKRQQSELENQKREQQQIAEDNRRQAMREKLDRRGNQLRALGMTFDFSHDCYVFQDVNVDNKTEICLLEDSEWDALVLKITPVITDRKREAEEKRQLKSKEDKRLAEEAATKKERDRIEEEQRQSAIKLQQEQERKAKELEAADDKTKWAAWVTEFKKVQQPPTMKSPAYRTKSAIAREKIEEIQSL